MRVSVNLQDLLALGDGQYRHGAAARYDSEQVVPPAPDTPTMFLNQLLQRDTHLLLDDTRIVHVSADAEQLRALVSFPSKTGEPAGTPSADSRRNSNSLDVCYRRRAAE